MLASKKRKPVKQQQNKRPKKSQNPQGRLLPGEAVGVASAYAKGVKNNRPTLIYSKNGSEVRVVHKEFVSNVTGSTAFATPIQLPLDPGLPTSFPWLSNIANNFEQYRANKIKVCYLTRTGTNVPGSVLLYPDYDAADTAPATEQIASNYAEIAEDAPWKDICSILRPAGMHALGPKKFVRNGVLANNLDIKTYDVGTFFLSTVDGTAVNWGKVWIEYDFTFYEPQVQPTGFIQPTSVAQGTAGTAAAMISAGQVLTGNLISGIAANVISFQNLIPGSEYFITFGGAGANAQSYAPSVPVGMTLKNFFEDSTVTYGETYIANTAIGSLTLTASGNITNPFITISPVPTGAL